MFVCPSVSSSFCMTDCLFFHNLDFDIVTSFSVSPSSLSCYSYLSFVVSFNFQSHIVHLLYLFLSVSLSQTFIFFHTNTCVLIKSKLNFPFQSWLCKTLWWWITIMQNTICRNLSKFQCTLIRYRRLCVKYVELYLVR